MTTENRELPSIDINRFLTISVNMLDSYFFKSTKEKARKLYKELERGEVIKAASLNFEGNKDSRVSINLSLDHSEYRGRLTFHLFRMALDMMLKNIAGRVQRKEDLNIFTSEETGEVLFHLPGLVDDRGRLNVLVMGIVPGKRNATVKLQFLDPEQFRKEQEATPDTAGSSTSR